MSTPTLQTIAEKAGVSRMTVSRVLRGDPAISEETRARVCKVAKEVNYRPNPLVSALMSHLRAVSPPRTTTTLAFIGERDLEKPAKQRPFFREIWSGAEARAKELGYILSPLRLKEPGLTPKRIDQIFRAQGVQGVIIGTLSPFSSLNLAWQRYSVVVMGHTFAQPLFDRVATNTFQSASLASATLRERGYRRTGLAIPPSGDLSRMFLGGYLAFQHRCPPKERLEPFYLEKPSLPAFRAWFRRQKPDSLITTKLALSWIQALGIKVPEDIGIVLASGYSDYAADYAYLQRDFARLGAAAVDSVVGQLHRNQRGIPHLPGELLIDAVWREGRSVRPPRDKSADVLKSS